MASSTSGSHPCMLLGPHLHVSCVCLCPTASSSISLQLRTQTICCCTQREETKTSLDRPNPVAHQTQNSASRRRRRRQRRRAWDSNDLCRRRTGRVSAPGHTRQIHQWHELRGQWPQARGGVLQPGGEGQLTVYPTRLMGTSPPSLPSLLTSSLAPPQLRKCFDTPLVYICPVGVWSADEAACLTYTVQEDFMSSTWDWIGLYKVLAQIMAFIHPSIHFKFV